MAPFLIALPQTQALKSESFQLPPCDGSLTIPEIYDWHLQHNPEHVLFTYTTSSGAHTNIKWKYGVHAIHRAARLLSDRFATQQAPSGYHDVPLVALFATMDHITYICTWLGLLRAGYAVFHISTRNSPAALAHLLTKSKSDYVLVSSDPGVRSVLNEALEIVEKGDRDWASVVSDVPRNEDLFPPGYEQDTPMLMPHRKFDLNSTVFYVHSSGTTAFPKPVRWSHLDWLGSFYGFQVGDHDFCDTYFGCHSVPPAHGLGTMIVTIAAFCGAILATFQPQSPPIVMAPDVVLEGAMSTRSDYIFCVPLFIELWSRDPVKVAFLKTLRGVIYGGGPLNKTVGDYLTEQGVNIYNTYGSSENGLLTPMLPSPPGMDWEYFTITKTFAPEYVPFGDGTYELVIAKCDTHSPTVFNTDVNGVKAYATGDLLVPHPTKEGHWKVFGRTDDQIMLNTGEKTNPEPLESILCQDAHVQAAVMFGRGRFQNGVLIQPKSGYAFDPRDEKALVGFRNAIWPTVERMNKHAPQHSRLFKEMILVTNSSKPFSFTAKGGARRQAILKDYEEEIISLYDAVAETTQQDITVPIDWTEEACLSFVRTVVHSVLKVQVMDDGDIFQHGCDSLQATWIRNTIARALRESPTTAGRTLPVDAVYSHPTVEALGHFVYHGTASNINTKPETRDRTTEMLKLVEQHSSNFSRPMGTRQRPVKEVVLVTGTTGAFGANILDALVKSDAIEHVFALNRRSIRGESLSERQRAALIERGLDGEIARSPKVTLLEADCSVPSFGVAENVFVEIRDTITCIVHNAWRVDFNLSLASFEPQLLSTRNLLDLALTSPLDPPPKVLFTSSVAAVYNMTSTNSIPEARIDHPEVAVMSGYGESKWIAEQILVKASEATASLRTVVIRLGQLAGGINGAWNTAEWFPSLIASGPVLNMLPDIDADISLIPVHEAVGVLLDFVLQANPPPFLHLAHPDSVCWTDVLSHTSKELNVPLVPYPEWLKALETDFLDPSKSEIELLRRNPALRLLQFFRGATQAKPGREAMGVPKLSTELAQRVSPTLQQLQPVGLSDVRKWLEYWERIGYLPRQSAKPRMTNGHVV